MNVLKRCCYRSMKENRKRTAVTIIGIILATALITALACLVVSFRVSLIAYEKEQNGDFHYHFLNVKQEYLKYFENNRQIEKYALTEETGYAVLEGCQNPDKPYLYVTAMDKEAETALSLKLVSGRMPENGSELVVGRHTGSNGLVEIKVGDSLNLSLGERISDGGFTLSQWDPYHGDEETFRPGAGKTFTVVGIIERPGSSVEPVTAPGYSAFTRLEDPAQAAEADVYATYTKQGLRHRDRVTAGILGVAEELYVRWKEGLQDCTEQEREEIQTVASSVQENYWLLKWELMLFADGMMRMIYAMSAVAVAVIIVTSVFCIRNSFVISLTEKMRLYGRLASVGTTAAQQRRIVYYEARFLSAVGIPLGVAGGLAAAVILVKGVSILVKDALGFEMIFGTSLPMILLAAVLAAVTVFLSARGSARQAARISPISAIRANDTVNPGKHIRCPGWIGGMFGIGGKIAYKNLRRARVKYRTTVVSIVVSVAIFIGMTTFVDLISLAVGTRFQKLPYQIDISIFQWDFYDEAVAIAEMDSVEEGEIVRKASLAVEKGQIPYTIEWQGEFAEEEDTGEDRIVVCSLGEKAYARYCREAGVSVEEARGKALVIADYHYETTVDGKTYIEEGNIADFKPGDILRGTGESFGTDIEVLKQTTVRPMYLADSGYSMTLIVDDAFMDSAPGLQRQDDIKVYLKCRDADETEQRIRSEAQLQYYSLTNYESIYRGEHSMLLVIAIFLYGFLAVVALIGITNVFNTVTTNMELRAPEFAMLRSVGMTGREFRRMIWLEGMFYGGKALCIGIPAGLLISLLFHRGFGIRFVTDYRVPWMGIVLSVAAVALLLYVIMRYSMAKINRRNIIDTIRNENI